MNASTISGAMNSADPTGVWRSGVVEDPPPEWNLIPEPRSKSHSLTGVTESLMAHSTFSGFKSHSAQYLKKHKNVKKDYKVLDKIYAC